MIMRTHRHKGWTSHLIEYRIGLPRYRRLLEFIIEVVCGIPHVDPGRPERAVVVIRLSEERGVWSTPFWALFPKNGLLVRLIGPSVERVRNFEGVAVDFGVSKERIGVLSKARLLVSCGLRRWL